MLNASANMLLARALGRGLGLKTRPRALPRSRRVTTQRSTSRGGLFSLSHLQEPSDFGKAARAAMEAADGLVAAVQRAPVGLARLALVRRSASAFTDTAAPIASCGPEAGTAALRFDSRTLPSSLLLMLQFLEPQLDRISDTLCQLIDAAELCVNVHSDAAWREAAGEACASVGAFIDNLNANVDVERALARVTSSSSVMEALERE